MSSMRVPWIRIVVGGLLATGFTIVAVFVAANGYSRLVAPDMSPEDLSALARKLGLVIGPTLGTLLTFAFGMWAGKGGSVRSLETGALVGVVAALILVPSFFTTDPSARWVYVLSMGLKVLGGAAGGWVCARRQSRSGLAGAA